MNKNGTIKIIDRAKNIFKLSQGEYIAPEKLENIYVQSEYILQCWIYGDSLRDFCIMFAVVDPEVLTNISKSKVSPQKAAASLMKRPILSDQSEQASTDAQHTSEKQPHNAAIENEELRKSVYDDILTLAKINKLNSLERPK